MKILLSSLFLLLAFAFSASGPGFDRYNCKCNDIFLFGKVRVVESGEDFRVRIVSWGEDLTVKQMHTLGYPKCGYWEFVTFDEDFTIKFVEYGGDFTIRFN